LFYFHQLILAELSPIEVILNGSKEQLLQRYQVVSGAIEDLDDELASLLIYDAYVLHK
jgi:ABC-2 type transport system ATP-binding protein